MFLPGFGGHVWRFRYRLVLSALTVPAAILGMGLGVGVPSLLLRAERVVLRSLVDGGPRWWKGGSGTEGALGVG